MSLEKISKQLGAVEQSYPPVELWNPPYCGEMDIVIKADGAWYYLGSKITRQRLVKLFASVLKKEGDDYFLVTPVEKVKIQVEQTPYIITSWQYLEEKKPQTMQLTTNLGDIFELNAEHPLTIDSNDALLVTVRSNLPASIHRNVFYQWAEMAAEKNQQLLINSAGLDFIIGRY